MSTYMYVPYLKTMYQAKRVSSTNAILWSPSDIGRNVQRPFRNVRRAFRVVQGAYRGSWSAFRDVRHVRRVWQ